MRGARAVLGGLAAGALLTGCAASHSPELAAPSPAAATARAAGTAAPVPAPARPAPPPAPAPPPTSAPAPPPTAAAPAPRQPRKESARTPARLSIPELGVDGVRVVRYVGEADDAPGTRIQDGGDLASPRGEGGGVGPGEVGNYVVTGHRTSHGAPLRDLPDLEEGELVHVRVGRTTYDYVVTDTLWISFRSERDKARQSAPVPGHPGREPTRPMITLSTCATPEDHAAGNYWSDEHGNPEHRIAKVGVLVDVRAA